MIFSSMWVQENLKLEIWPPRPNIVCLYILNFKILANLFLFLAHLSLRLTQGELIVYQSSCRLCVIVSTLSNMNISETSGPITTKFHHLSRGKSALGFEPGRILTLVSMATNSSHRVVMGKLL